MLAKPPSTCQSGDKMTTSKWDERQEATRARVLCAAQELLASDGLDGLSIRKLAATAGVAVGTIYNQFGDRSGVLSAMVSEGLDTLATSLDPRIEELPLDSSRSLITALLDRYENEESIWRPVFLALKSQPGDHGLGVSGERLLSFILSDLDSAAAADMLVKNVATDRLAQHLLNDQVALLSQWAFGGITISEFRERSTRSLELSLAAVLVEPHRSTALRHANID